MSTSEENFCLQTLNDNIDVFNNNVSEGYNNFSGELDVDWNWLNNQLPPPNIMKHPTYSNTKMKILLQEKIDFMESQNICMKAHTLGVPVQYASLPMLVPKSSLKTVTGNPTHINYRFVTLFNKLNEYIAMEPSQPDNIEETLYDVGQWKYIIVGDLSNSFHQRWIAKSKLPWMAFPSPYKGMYILLRSGQGMKNQSEGLQHKMRMVLGDLIQQGKARIIADDIQTGGKTVMEALENWKLILQACAKNNIKIDPKKTKILSNNIHLLGWIKKNDSLHPDPHRILAIQKAEFPNTVSDMRSYLGTYKTFFKSMENMAQILHPLEQVTGEKDGKAKIEWNPELSKAFKVSQQSIGSISPLYQPKREDQLVITLDWSKKGIGATLYAVSGPEKKIVEYFSAKLKGNQINWPPCDGEGLALATALKRFSHFLREAFTPTIVASDNKTVIQALNLMATGSFSTSPRLNALLSSINIYPLKFRHISGKFKLNQDSDASSRQPMNCQDKQCSVCTFISDQANILDKVHNTNIRNIHVLPQPDLCEDNCHHNIFVKDYVSQEHNRNVSIDNVIDGSASLPFLSHRYVLQLQNEDPVLTKLKNHLTSGSRPRKVDNKNNELKHYLTLNPKINRDGLIVVDRTIQPHLLNLQVPIIPSSFATSIISAVHVKLNHPNMNQMIKACNRNFCVLKQRQQIESVVKSCINCLSQAKLPRSTKEFQNETKPSHPGTHWAADVNKHSGQTILVCTDNFSSFTRTKIIKSETKNEQKNAIIDNILPLRSVTGNTTVRMDTAPALASLAANQEELNQVGIYLEQGYQKNKNSLAKVDKTIQELRAEIRKYAPEGHTITNLELQLATEKLNMRIRDQNLSAREIFFRRKQESDEPIPFQDDKFSSEQKKKRGVYNVYKSVNQPEDKTDVKLHSLVFITNEYSKLKARELYMVTKIISDSEVIIQKLIHFQSKQQGKLQPKQYNIHPAMLTVYNIMNTNILDTKSSFQDLPVTPTAESTGVPKQNIFSFISSDESETESISIETALDFTPEIAREEIVEENQANVYTPEVNDPLYNNFGAKPKVYTHKKRKKSVRKLYIPSIKDTEIIDYEPLEPSTPAKKHSQWIQDQRQLAANRLQHQLQWIDPANNDIADRLLKDSIVSPLDDGNLAWDTSFDVNISTYETADENDSYLHLQQLSESVLANVFEEEDELNEAFDVDKFDLQLLYSSTKQSLQASE